MYVILRIGARRREMLDVSCCYTTSVPIYKTILRTFSGSGPLLII